MAGFMTPQYPDLSKMFGQRSVMPTVLGQQQLQQANDQHGMNMQLAQQLMQHNQVMNPLLQKHQEMETQNMGSIMQGRQAQTDRANYELEMDKAIPKEQKIKALMQKMAREMSDDELKVSMNALERAAVFGNDDEKKKAITAMQYMKEMMKARVAAEERGDTARDVANIHALSNERVEKMRIDAGKYDKQWKTDILTKIEMEGDPTKKLSLLLDAAKMAQQRGDKTSYEDLMTRAEFQSNLVKAKLRQNRDPNKINIEGVTDGEVTRNPESPVMPNDAPKPAPAASAPSLSTTQEDWVNRAMKANPGMTREQVIEQGRKSGKIK